MNDETNEVIEMASREEPKPKKKHQKKKKNREVVQQQIDLTVDEDIKEIEDFKQQEDQYDPEYQYEQQDKYAQYDQYGNYDDDLQQGYKHDYDDQYDDELLQMGDKDYPPIPTKAIVFTLMLLMIGIGLILAGVFSYINHEGTTKIILFVLFGIGLVTPGFIYGLFLVQAASAGTPEEKQEILNQLPV